MLYAITTDLNSMSNIVLVLFSTEEEMKLYYNKASNLLNSINSKLKSESIGYIVGLDFDYLERLANNIEGFRKEFDSLSIDIETRNEIQEEATELLEMFFPEHGYGGCGSPFGIKMIKIEEGEPIIPRFDLD